MECFFALALCLLVSSSTALSPPKIPDATLVPLNCNETDAQVRLAIDLTNKDPEKGFVLRPVRTTSVFQQQLNHGASIYYIDVNVIETECSVLSGKKWEDCNEDVPFHSMVHGECKIIFYLSKIGRKLEVLAYSCNLSPPPSSSIARLCPDCPIIVSNITEEIEAKAKHLVEEFNKESNQTHYFKLRNIERVRTQWMFGWSYFFYQSIEETDCLKTQADVNLDQCHPLKKAHVGFCTGSSYNTPDRAEKYSVLCEIYEPRDDDHHHHHKHEHCDHEEEGPKVDQTQDNADASEAGASDAPDKGQSKDSKRKCELHKGKCFGRQTSHKHRCHHHHRHHDHHPGHHHHHHHHRHNHSDPHHHHHHRHNHSDPHHHHHHPLAEQDSSSEESIDQKTSEHTSKGSVEFYYPDNGRVLPHPTITHLPPARKGRNPWDNVPKPLNFPNEASPLATCPGGPAPGIPATAKRFLFA